MWISNDWLQNEKSRNFDINAGLFFYANWREAQYENISEDPYKRFISSIK